MSTSATVSAAKYSLDGSTIEVELICDQKDIALQVIDQGIGIPDEELPRLFEAFYRVSNMGVTSGTGLGLAIVKQSVELHGGTVRCASREEGGTVFTVTLPKIAPEEGV